jgi:hypothetical protein
MSESAVMIRALDVPIHLRAEEAASKRVIGITGNPDGASVTNGDECCAGIWTIVRASSANDRVARAEVCGSCGSERGFHQRRIRGVKRVANAREVYFTSQ